MAFKFNNLVVFDFSLLQLLAHSISKVFPFSLTGGHAFLAKIAEKNGTKAGNSDDEAGSFRFKVRWPGE